MVFLCGWEQGNMTKCPPTEGACPLVQIRLPASSTKAILTDAPINAFTCKGNTEITQLNLQYG